MVQRSCPAHSGTGIAQPSGSHFAQPGVAMNLKSNALVILSAACFAFHAYAQPAGRTPAQTGDVPRPSDSAANRPSESGAQTNLPAGAASGAGQPQGRAQPAQAQSPDSAKAKSAAKGSARTKTSTQPKHTTTKKKKTHRSTSTKRAQPATASSASATR